MQQKNSHEIEEGKKTEEVVNESNESFVENQVEEQKGGVSTNNHAEEKSISDQNEIIATYAELDRVNALLEATHNKYVQLYAEFENYKKRVLKEKKTIIETANASILKKILSVVDDFERGIDAFQGENDNQYQAMREGIKLIYDKIIHTLHQAGVQSMTINIGDNFDVERHEVIGQSTVGEGVIKGKIVNVAEKGYWINEHVLRFAKVIIGS